MRRWYTQMKLFLKICYDGSAYSGYQTQRNGLGIQQVLGEAAERLFGTRCDICGCSRTDRGVHANEFCLTVCEHGQSSLSTTVPSDGILRALNTYLPPDIAVLAVDWRPEDFHARYSARGKQYVYRIYNAPIRSPFEEGRALHYPRPLDDEALERMQRAASHLLGRHDFTSFMASGSDVTSRERTVSRAEFVRNGDVISFYIAADGFLYNMVRIIVGTLLEVAEGRREPESIPALISARDRRCAGRTAPACGLYLDKVFY